LEAIEVVGFLFAVTGIYFSTKRKIIYWPLSIISSAAYLVFFFQIQLYADAFLQVFFIVSSVYAWIHWRNNILLHQELRISQAKVLSLLKLSVVALMVGLLLGWGLARWTNASFPYLDSTLFSFSILATYLSAKAILQNWILWILINACYIMLYISKHAYLTSALYFILIILAILGYLNWKKNEFKAIN